MSRLVSFGWRAQVVLIPALLALAAIAYYDASRPRSQADPLLAPSLASGLDTEGLPRARLDERTVKALADADVPAFPGQFVDRLQVEPENRGSFEGRTNFTAATVQFVAHARVSPEVFFGWYAARLGDLGWHIYHNGRFDVSPGPQLHHEYQRGTREHLQIDKQVTGRLEGDLLHRLDPDGATSYVFAYWVTPFPCGQEPSCGPFPIPDVAP